MTAVIWDIGGVLVRRRPEAGLEELFDTPTALEAMLRETDFEAWNAAFDDPSLAPDAPPEATWFAAYRDNVAAAHSETTSGSVALLERLHAAGVPLYAVSNTARASAAAMREAHGFMAFFRDAAFSAVEGVRKPDPEIWRRLLARNGLAAEDCVFIDDGAKHIEAARRLGLGVIHFENAEQCAAALRAEGLPA